MSKKLEFSIEMAALRKAVNYVRNGLGNSKTDLSVMILRFDLKGNNCSAFATDKEVFTRVDMPVINNGEDGVFGVMGAKIEKLISQVDAEVVRFRVDDENVEVSAGFLVVNFEVYDESTIRVTEMSLLDESAALESWNSLPRSSFEEGLVISKSCTTSTSIRPDVNHVEFRHGRMLCSDGRKILVLSHDSFPVAMGLKIPAAALNSMIGAVKNADTETLAIAEGKSYYYLKAKGYLMGVRKIERDFPQVENMVASLEDSTDEVTIDKLVLEGMVKGVALGLASDDVKVQVDLVGFGTDSVLEASTLNSVGRRSYERASCGRKLAEPLSFPISFKHLLDTLGVFKGDSVVDMMVLDNKSILLVRDTTDDRQVLTVIPFRTKDAVEQEKKEAEARQAAREKASAEGTAAAVEPESVQDVVEA